MQPIETGLCLEVIRAFAGKRLRSVLYIIGYGITAGKKIGLYNINV